MAGPATGMPPTTRRGHAARIARVRARARAHGLGLGPDAEIVSMSGRLDLIAIAARAEAEAGAGKGHGDHGVGAIVGAVTTGENESENATESGTEVETDETMEEEEGTDAETKIEAAVAAGVLAVNVIDGGLGGRRRGGTTRVVAAIVLPQVSARTAAAGARSVAETKMTMTRTETKRKSKTLTGQNARENTGGVGARFAAPIPTGAERTERVPTRSRAAIGGRSAVAVHADLVTAHCGPVAVHPNPTWIRGGRLRRRRLPRRAGTPISLRAWRRR